MNKKIIARIRWVPTDQDGKKRFPLTEYSTAAHFHTDENGQDWSVVLKNFSSHNNYEMICDLCFLFPDNVPNRLLFIGSKFELYESKKVADGEIIEC
ncbi:hypothetical protein [Paenibacillus pini]|uniref:hypothetical protein n=1 Tax=Paenibacillus pini TaxID=669461 RepID=UPI00055BA598|nr:hypothetical protein [Paenibacillus pini]